jgi:hypothetical protein
VVVLSIVPILFDYELIPNNIQRRGRINLGLSK